MIPLAGKPEDLLVAKTALGKDDQMQINSKVFTCPASRSAASSNIATILRYDDDHVSSPTWEIQRPYFVHQARYLFYALQGIPARRRHDTSMYLTDEHGAWSTALIWWIGSAPWRRR
jgi:hypothetical protein